MPGRWVTFDCFGTIVDWNAGARGARWRGVRRRARGLADRRLPRRRERVKHGDGYHRYRDVLAARCASSARPAAAPSTTTRRT